MFLNQGRGGLIFKYAFRLFISLHHDFLGSSFSHGGEFFFSQRVSFSLTEDIFFLTEHTDVTEPFHQRSEPTERLRHTDITERFS